MPMQSLLLTLVLAAAEAPKTPAQPPARPELKLEPPERYRMVLGAPVGRFNDWEKLEVSRFYGLVTTVRIAKIDGKPGDAWASVARVNLIGPGDEKSRPVLALVLQFDRKTHKPMAYFTRSGDDKTYGFKADLPADQPIQVRAVANRPGKMIVGLNDFRFEIDLPFEVAGVSAVASGLDAAFEPFELMRRAP